MSKIGEFVEKYANTIASPDNEEKTKCRADFRSTVESLFMSDEELEEKMPIELDNIEKMLIPGMSEMRKRAEIVRHHDVNRLRREGVNWLCSRLLAAIDANEHE